MDWNNISLMLKLRGDEYVLIYVSLVYMPKVLSRLLIEPTQIMNEAYHDSLASTPFSPPQHYFNVVQVFCFVFLKMLPLHFQGILDWYFQQGTGRHLTNYLYRKGGAGRNILIALGIIALLLFDCLGL